MILEIEAQLLNIAKELGLIESEEMVRLRKDFAKEKETDNQRVRDMLSLYVGLCQKLSATIKSPESNFALNIMLVILYLPRQNEEVANAFKDASYHASQFCNIRMYHEFMNALAQIK